MPSRTAGGGEGLARLPDWEDQLVTALGALCSEAVDSAKHLGVTLKIVINAVSAKMGGAVTYLTNIFRCLPPPESGYEFDVFTPPEAAERQRGLPRNVRLVATSVGQAAMEEILVGTGHPAAMAEEAES